MIVPRKLADEGSSARNFAVRGLTGSLILNAASQRVLALEQRHSRSANLRNDGRACTINRVSSWILSRSYRPVRDGRDVSSHETLRAGDQEDRRQTLGPENEPPVQPAPAVPVVRSAGVAALPLSSKPDLEPCAPEIWARRPADRLDSEPSWALRTHNPALIRHSGHANLYLTFTSPENGRANFTACEPGGEPNSGSKNEIVLSSACWRGLA